MKLKEDRKRVKAYEQLLKESAKKEKEDLRARQEENKKKREENQRKCEIFQEVIFNKSRHLMYGSPNFLLKLGMLGQFHVTLDSLRHSKSAKVILIIHL